VEKAACAEDIAAAEACSVELNGRLAAAGRNISNDEPLLRRVLDAENVTDEVLALIDCVLMYEPERIEIRFAFCDANALGVV
jgi:hypothetical protein